MYEVKINYHPADKKNEEVKAALDGTFAIASVGIATLEMLETLLPAAAQEVERESKLLTVNFMCVMNYLDKQKKIIPVEVVEAIAGIIIGLQFQDRNTQIMENVTCILERYRSMLEDVCGNINNMRDGDVATSHDVAKAVEHILSSIRLTDIRTRYMEALVKAKVHSHDANHLPVVEEENSKEIELF